MNKPSKPRPRRSSPAPAATLWRRLRSNPRRLLRWWPLLPALAIIWLAFTYASIAVTMQGPDQLILGAKGVEVLDRNGQLLYTFSDEPNSSVISSLEQVSPDLVKATVGAEDANFWKNPGVNLKGIARAVYENLAFWDHGGFFHGSGGSSITQQLAKNLYIKPADRYKRSPMRKVKETLLAFELNRRYSKQQILEWYLSGNYYGHGAYGVESASYRYFNKPPKDLSLAQSALIAGIPRSPTAYDPIADYDAAIARQQEVIGLMERHKIIDAATAEAARKEPIALREGHSPSGQANIESIAPHFSAYVREMVPSLLGKGKIPERLRITTTIDRDLQQKAQDTVKTNLDKFEKSLGASNGGLVAMDPKTGEILAMVGSHDFEREDISGQVNNALALNQPGSTMKAVTYLAAFMKGWAPSTIIVDEPLKVQDGESSFTLKNADNVYRGSVPIRTAFGSSLNVPAVKALQYAGLEEVYALAKRMGLSTLESIDNYGPAFTLGGVDVSLLDMTYVYSVLANQGEQAGMPSVLGLPKGNRNLDPIAVLKIESVDGKLLWKAKQQKERIVPANATYLVTSVLSDDKARTSMFGANSALNLKGRPAAVKSGASDNTRDAWSIGWTPQLVTGVWVGNANNKPMPGATSTSVAAPIWNAFMTAALQGKPALSFDVPDGIQFARVCATTGQAPAAGCTSVVDEPFLSNRLPAGTMKQPTQVLPSPTRPVPSGGLLVTPAPPLQTFPTPVNPGPFVSPTRPVPNAGLLNPPTATPPVPNGPGQFGQPGRGPSLVQPSPTQRRGVGNGNRNDQ